MSWIFGYLGNTERLNISSPPEKPLHSVKNSGLQLYCGGNDRTSFHSVGQKQSGWTVVGIGKKTKDNYEILDKND